jgi:hypothetical protein
MMATPQKSGRVAMPDFDHGIFRILAGVPTNGAA